MARVKFDGVARQAFLATNTSFLSLGMAERYTQAELHLLQGQADAESTIRSRRHLLSMVLRP